MGEGFLLIFFVSLLSCFEGRENRRERERNLRGRTSEMN